MALAICRPGVWAGPPTLLTTNLPANDLAYAAVDESLYVAVGTRGGALANRLVALDPADATVRWSLPVAPEPARLEVSGDGRFLFLGFVNTNAIVQVDLAARQIVRRFSGGVAAVRRMSTVELRAHPAEPETVAQALGTPFSDIPNAFLLFRGGEVLTNVPRAAVGLPGFSADGQRFFLTGMSGTVSFDWVADGFVTNGISTRLDLGVLRAVDTRLFGDNGPVLDSRTLAKVGQHPLTPAGVRFVVAPDLERAFLLETAAGLRLWAVDLATYRSAGMVTLSVPGAAPGSRTRLVNLGRHGLAFNLEGTTPKVVRVRPGFMPSPTAANLALEFPQDWEPILRTDPAGGAVIRGARYQVRIQNPGPGDASGVRVTNQLPVRPDTRDVSVSTGTWVLNPTANGSALVWTVGDLGMGGEATMEVAIEMTAPGSLFPVDPVFTADVTAEEDDPDLTDNAGRTRRRSLDGGTLHQIPVYARDVVADDAAGRLYVTSRGRAGFLGNSVVMVDPAKAQITGTVLAGSEPRNLELAPTAGQVTVELTGADTNFVRLDLLSGAIVEATKGPAPPAKPTAAVDEAAGRTYSIAPVPNGNSTRLHVVDHAVGLEVATLTLPRLGNAAGQVVRWGTQGLAMLQSDASPPSLFVLSHPLIVPGPSTDLAVRLSATGPEPMVTSHWVLTATVTNAGPVAAEGVTIEVAFPSDFFEYVGQQPGPPLADPAVEPGQARFRWPGPLPPGGTYTLELTLKPLFAGPVGVQAAVAGLGKDLHYDNNRTTLETQVGYQLAPDSLVQVRLPVSDLVYDATRGEFYAGVLALHPTHGNQIVALDPETGRIRRAVAAGSAPGRLAVSDDGHYLYAVLAGGTTVRRYRLPGLESDLDFPVGEEPPYGPLVALYVQVVPGRAEVVAIARSQPLTVPDQRGIALYENGVPLPATTQDGGYFLFDATGKTLYLGGWYFDTYAVTPEGLSNTGRYEGPRLGSQPVLVDGRLYSGSGQVIELETLRLAGAFPTGEPTTTDVFVPDPAADRAYAVSDQHWMVYDLQSYQRLAAVPLPSGSGLVDRLWRWGGDAFAYATRNGTAADQVVFLRSGLAPSGEPAEVALELEVQSVPGEAPQRKRLVGLLRNHGPGIARALRVELRAPYGYDFRGTTPGSAAEWTTTFGGSPFTCTLASLDPGATARLGLELEETTSAWRLWSIGGTVLAATPDPELDNNYAAAFSVHQPPGPLPHSQPCAWIASDMVYDRWQQRLILSVPELPGLRGGCLLPLDPVTLRAGRPLRVGQQPNQMALAEDGRSLYVSVDGTRAVVRVDLERWQVEETVPLGLNLVAFDLEPVPGFPQAVAISRRDLTMVPGNAGILVIGLPGGGRVESAAALPWLAPGGSLGQLFGYHGSGLCALHVSTFGITQGFCGGFLDGVTDLHYAAGRIFSDNGRVLAADDFRLLTELFVSHDQATLPDPTSGLIFRLRGDWLAVHDLSTYADRGGIPAGSGLSVAAFLRWGLNGLAYIASGYPHLLPQAPGLPVDTDRDGLPDDWETAHQLDPLQSEDAEQDADGDGASNRAEFQAGTDPRRASSRLGLEWTRAQDGWQLVWSAAAGRAYRLQRTQALGGAESWVTVAEFAAGEADRTLVGPTPPEVGAGMAYYRVLVTPPMP